MPGVRVYPYKEVESGAQIYESLIWESRASSRLFERDSVSGLVNVDLTPEVATRLAVAFGTALARGSRVVASREASASCRMIERAMIAGLNSTGVEIADLRALPSAVGRHLLKTHDYAAGFHVGFDAAEPELVQIRFFEEPGIQLSTALQKEVEKHFTRGELRRSAATGVGNVDYPGARQGELRGGASRDARPGRDPWAGLPHRRRLRILGGIPRAAVRARPARRRGRLCARLRAAGARRDRREPARPDRSDEEARRRGRRRPRRRLRPRGGAALPDRRERARDPRRAGAAPLPEADRIERPPREARLPGHGHEPGRPDRQGERAAGDPDAARR